MNGELRSVLLEEDAHSEVSVLFRDDGYLKVNVPFYALSPRPTFLCFSACRMVWNSTKKPVLLFCVNHFYGNLPLDVFNFIYLPGHKAPVAFPSLQERLPCADKVQGTYVLRAICTLAGFGSFNPLSRSAVSVFPHGTGALSATSRYLALPGNLPVTSYGTAKPHYSWTMGLYFLG